MNALGCVINNLAIENTNVTRLKKYIFLLTCTNRIVAQSNTVKAAPNWRAVTCAAWSKAIFWEAVVSANASPIAENNSSEKKARNIESQIIGAIYWMVARESEKTWYLGWIFSNL